MRPVDAGSFAERVYDELSPVAARDEEFDWALLLYLGGLGKMFQEVEDLARDTDAGPGWSALLDLDRIPDSGLYWLAQFVGVQLPPGLTPAQQRLRIASTDGWQRGTVAAIVGAVQQFLIGNKEVILFERDSSPYHFEIRTREIDTPLDEWPVTNLAPDPSFESGALAPNWTSVAGNTGVAFATSSGIHGSRNAQAGLTVGAGPWSAVIETIDYIPVNASLDYILSAYFRKWAGAGSAASAIRINCYNASNTLLGFTYPNVAVAGVNHGNGHFGPAAGAFERWGGMYRGQAGVSGTAVGGFMAGTTKVKITIFLFYNVGAGYQVLLDGVQLEQASRVSPFAVGTRAAGSAHIRNAILEQKPAGLQFEYHVIPDWTYDDLDAAYASYDAIDADFATYEDIDDNNPI